MDTLTPRPAAPRSARSRESSGNQVRRGEHQLVLSGVNQRKQHLEQAVPCLSRTGWDDLDVRGALGFHEMETRARHEIVERLPGLKRPVADHGDGERDHDGILHANHGIDPLADARPLLEVTRIHEIHAARPCHLAVNDDDLPVETKVGTADKDAEQSDR